MKITAKTTKEQMKAFLKDNLAVAKGDLKDRVAYALKAKDEKITRKDLVDLVKEVNEILKDVPHLTLVEPKAENSLKKPVKKEEVPEESEESEETAEETEETEAPVKEKKPKKSKLGKNKKSKEGVVALNKDTSERAILMAKLFPKTLEVETESGTITLKLAEDIKTMDDLYEALEKEEKVVFAYYWTKRHLKQFGYFNNSLGVPKSFANDLDLATAIWIAENKSVCYQVSMYTDACYMTLPDNIPEEDNVRYAGGVEYQIYRIVEDEQEETEESAE